MVDLGTITPAKPTAAGATFARESVFMPTNPVGGIEPFGHPLIDALVQACGVSFGWPSQ